MVVREKVTTAASLMAYLFLFSIGLVVIALYASSYDGPPLVGFAGIATYVGAVWAGGLILLLRYLPSLRRLSRWVGLGVFIAALAATALTATIVFSVEPLLPPNNIRLPFVVVIWTVLILTTFETFRLTKRHGGQERKKGGATEELGSHSNS